MWTWLLYFTLTPMNYLGGLRPLVTRMVPVAGPFRSVWLASGLYMLASWVIQIALMITVLHRQGPGTLAWIMLAGTLPALLSGPVSGWMSDTLSLRTLTLLSVGGRVLTALLMGWLLRISLPLATIAYVGYGLTGAIWRPLRQRLVYVVVPPADRGAANAIIGSWTGVVTLVGAVSGGVLAGWNPSGTFLVASLVLLACLVTLAPAVPRDRTLAPSVPVPSSWWTALVEGFTAVRTTPQTLGIVVIGSAWGLIGGGYDVLLGAFATRIFPGPADNLGLLYAVDGVGVLMGSLGALRIAPGKRMVSVTVAYVAQALGWMAFSSAPTLVVAFVLLLMMRLASGVIIALDPTLLLANVPDSVHGRVVSFHAATYGMVVRISLALMGLLLAGGHVRVVGLLGGALSVAVTLWWAVWMHKRGALRFRAGEAESVPATSREID